MLLNQNRVDYNSFFIDIRSMKPIIEWKGQPSCMAQFSFDENSIYSVDNTGEVIIHNENTNNEKTKCFIIVITMVNS